MSCSVGMRRTSSDASVPKQTWAESAGCHKVAILISSSNLQFQPFEESVGALDGGTIIYIYIRLHLGEYPVVEEVLQ